MSRDVTPAIAARETARRMAVCCRTPLVGTILFYKQEWFCVRCGKTYPFLRPATVPWTADLEAEWQANRETFREASQGALVVGMRRSDCGLCATSGDYSHMDHADADELEASAEAWRRIDAMGAGR